MNTRNNISVWIYRFIAAESIASNIEFRKGHNHGESVSFPWQRFVKNHIFWKNIHI